MLTNYIKISLRNLNRQKATGAITILGLALGMSCAFVIGIYVIQELTYERGFEDSDRIYRIAADFYGMGGFAKSQGQLLDHLPDATTSIQRVTRVDGGSGPLRIVADDQEYETTAYLFADSAFFDVFSYVFVEGDPATALHQPDGVVISRELAATYFGEGAVSGKTLRIGKEERIVQVAGVVEKPGFNTHLDAELWLPLDHSGEWAAWTNVEYYNYVKVAEGKGARDIEEGIERVLRNTAFPAVQFAGTFEEWIEGPIALTFWVQPLHDIYLHSDFQFELTPGGNPNQVYMLGLIGVLVLLIAGFNYVNLTTATAAIRMKEIGVKQSMGAGKGALVRQFLSESVVYSAIAMVIAAALVEVVLSAFEYVSGVRLVEGVLADGTLLLALFVCSLGIGVVAGMYPAFYLANLEPSLLLKGAAAGASRGRLRKVLVVTQFAIAIALIVCSGVIYHQMSFMKEADKGFDHEGVLVVKNWHRLAERQGVFKENIERLTPVVSTTAARRIPTGSAISMYFYKTPEMAEGITIQTFRGDEQYVPTLGMRLVAGRNFSGELASDTTAAILNESAVRALELGDDPIGKEVAEDVFVVGVISDFNYQSLRTKIEPAVIRFSGEGRQLAVKLSGYDVAGFIDAMEEAWQRLNVEDPISYYFLDENFEALVEEERLLGRAISLFTILALTISCMGLFGLTTFATQRRTKEIGIRKVLGATVPQLIGLLSRDFLMLVGIAFLIASPIAYLAMTRWLEGFAYRIDLGMAVFFGAGVLAGVLAFLTLSYHAIRAARSNPVEALHHE